MSESDAAPSATRRPSYRVEPVKGANVAGLANGLQPDERIVSVYSVGLGLEALVEVFTHVDAYDELVPSDDARYDAMYAAEASAAVDPDEGDGSMYVPIVGVLMDGIMMSADGSARDALPCTCGRPNCVAKWEH